jgi:hypothetical protein
MSETTSPKAAREKRPTFRLVLRAEPRVDPVPALKRGLKFLLRRCGLRCISVEEIQQ